MFPDLNQHSLPLLILVMQGLIFVVLLLSRYFKKRNVSDLYLALILLLTCYFQICYTVGFMGWYNTFRNTKINYFLINIGLALAPLIYLYVKSITQSNFKFKKNYWWFFAPVGLVIVYRLFIFTYDALQPGFSETQNGILKIEWDERYVQSFLWFIETPWMLLFLAYTFQLFFQYRRKIKNYFSNTFRLELNWILSFLILFSLSFIYGNVQDIISVLHTELHYVQRWWLNLFMALITLYVGIRGYFTDTTKLNKLSFSFHPTQIAIPETDEINEEKSLNTEDLKALTQAMEVDKAYLNPELNLQDLANLLGMTRAQLSELINSGFHQNFNDFVNSYRVEAFKTMLKNNRQEQLSLLGIAHECGFNSKATFNRVFKKLTHHSPTEYLKSQLN